MRLSSSPSVAHAAASLAMACPSRGASPGATDGASGGCAVAPVSGLAATSGPAALPAPSGCSPEGTARAAAAADAIIAAPSAMRASPAELGGRGSTGAGPTAPMPAFASGALSPATLSGRCRQQYQASTPHPQAHAVRRGLTASQHADRHTVDSRQHTVSWSSRRP